MPEIAFCPGKIILSRKGWDTTDGGKPSPILPNGSLLSLPITDRGSGIRFENFRSPDDRIDIGILVADLTHKRVDKNTELHLDPDLRCDAIDRHGFRPAFGQCGRAQKHLENKEVCEGDLFLFFGVFRQVEECKGWRYVQSAPMLHLIFGWLQVGEIFHLPEDVEKLPDGLERHPHRIPSGRVNNNANTLYIARPRLTFSELPGWGLFQAGFHLRGEDDARRLSRPNTTRPTEWRLPSFFKGLSNMGTQPEPCGRFWEPQRKGPGQEFVLPTSDRSLQLCNWLSELFSKAAPDRTIFPQE